MVLCLAAPWCRQTAWSPALEAPVKSWQWAGGHTPFGPFSSSTSLSLLLRDTALRNSLLALLNRTVSSALLLLHKLEVGAASLLPQWYLPSGTLPLLLLRGTALHYALRHTVPSSPSSTPLLPVRCSY